MTLCNIRMQRTLNGGSLSSEMGDMIKLLPSSVEIEWVFRRSQPSWVCNNSSSEVS